MSKEVTLTVIPGGPYDQFVNSHKDKMPKKSEKFLFNMVDTYGTDKLLQVNYIDIGNYVYNVGIIHGINMNVGRNLPWIEDGLKSGERRVLYTMHEDKLYNNSSVKVASIAGSMVKTVYPHGENAITDTIYRVGREKTMMIPYIKPGGNFGGMDTLRAAAPRYASASLSDYAMDCFFGEIGAKYPIYDVKDNYQYNGVEPVFLTSRYPNILMQWNLGIGKGAASWIGAFNSKDIFKTTMLLMDDPNAKVDIYPDTPVPIDIINKAELKGCFDKKKFNVDMRGQYEFRTYKRADKNGSVQDVYAIVFKSLPLKVIGETIDNEIRKIKDLDTKRVNKRFPEILNIFIDAKDYYPGGLEFYIEYEKGYDPEVLVEKLFKSTSLGKTISVSYTLVSNNKPDRYTPREILNQWITQRYDQKRRFYHQKALYAAKEKSRLTAICIILKKDNIDTAIKIIRSSANKSMAIEKLRKQYDFSDFQARMVLQINLGNLPKMNVEETEKELQMREDEYKYYRKILTSNIAIKEKIIEELTDGMKKYGKDRKATLKNLKQSNLGDPNETKYVVYNSEKYFCLNELNQLKDIDRDINKEYKIIKLQNKDMIIIFSKTGIIKVLNGYAFTFTTDGISISNIAFNNTVSIVPLNSNNPYDQIVMITKFGYGKRMDINDCIKSLKGKVINLNENDKLVDVIPVVSDHDDSDIIGMITNDTIYYTKLSEFPVLKRSSSGNRIIKIKSKEPLNISSLVYFSMSDCDYLFIYGESGYVKILDTMYLKLKKSGYDMISLQGKDVFGAVGLHGTDANMKLYDTDGVTDINMKIDKFVQFSNNNGEVKKFKMSTTIGSPVKIFKKNKNDFYYLK